jgi:hypothetical protein
MDYQCNTNASLSAPDRDHFATLANLLCSFKRESQDVAVLPSEMQQLATYFWKYLHEPCQALEIPAESVLVCIHRMLRYSNCYRGSYRGCNFSILRDCGLDCLAAKIYLDQKILIPRIIDDSATRHKMHAAVSEFRAMYFTRIFGVEGSTSAESFSDNSREWTSLQTVVYDPTARGKKFEKLRKESTVAASVQLSIRHWVAKVEKVVEAVKKRGKEGKRVNTSVLYPEDWIVFNDDVALPNFFEERRLNDGELM